MKSTQITTEDDSTRLSTQPVFVPTPYMKVWLDTALQMVGDPVSKIAEEAEITEQAYYKWKKQEGFWDWYVAEYTKRRSRLIPELDSLAMKFAKKGSFSHLELMTKKAGDYPAEQKSGSNVQVNVFTEAKERAKAYVQEVSQD